jgi:hypothetical protein
MFVKCYFKWLYVYLKTILDAKFCITSAIYNQITRYISIQKSAMFGTIGKLLSIGISPNIVTAKFTTLNNFV